MKKQYFLIGLFASLSLFGQENLIANPGFETRENANAVADDWYTYYTTSADQTSREKHSGDYSVRLISQRSFNANIYQEGEFDWGLWEAVLPEVKPNQAHKLSFWVLDETDKAQLKYDIRWLDEDKNTIATTDEFSKPTTYSETKDGWQNLEFKGKSPANAKYFRIAFEVTKEGEEFGGSIYLDDVSFVEIDNSELSVNQVELSKTIKLTNTVVKDNFSIIGATKGSLEVYSAIGTKVLQTQFSERTPINISGLAKGIYLLKIETEKGIVTKKIIKE